MRRWHRWVFSIFRIATPAWMPRRTRWSRLTPSCRGRSFVRLLSGSGASPMRIASRARDAKPIDAVLMFKTLVLSAFYNLSDDQIEYQVRDRLSFMCFLGLGLGDRVPDARTVWLYRDAPGARRARWRRCSGCLTITWRGRDILRGAGRSSTPPSCQRRATTTRARRTRPTRRARCPRIGQTSPPSAARKIWTPAGQKSTARASTAPGTR